MHFLLHCNIAMRHGLSGSGFVVVDGDPIADRHRLTREYESFFDFPRLQSVVDGHLDVAFANNGDRVVRASAFQSLNQVTTLTMTDLTNGTTDVVVTDTIPLSDEARNCGKVRQLSVANMLAETIRRVHEDESVSSIYMD